MDYDFDIVYNKGSNHCDADFLSRNPFKEKRKLEKVLEEDDFPSLHLGTVRFEIEDDNLGAENLYRVSNHRSSKE